MKAIRIAGIALMLTAALANAAQDGFVLKYTPKKGDVTKLRIKGNLSIQGMDITANILSQSTVKEVNADGSYELEDKQLGGTASFGGQEMEIPETPARTTLHNADGTVKEIRGDEVGGAEYRMANLNAWVAPKEAVKIGSKWVQEVKGDSEKGTVDATREYEVIAEETIDGEDTLVIKAKVTEKSGSEPAAISGKSWVSKKTGDLVKAEQTWTNVPMPGAPGAISGTFTITREK